MSSINTDCVSCRYKDREIEKLKKELSVHKRALKLALQEYIDPVSSEEINYWIKQAEGK